MQGYRSGYRRPRSAPPSLGGPDGSPYGNGDVGPVQSQYIAKHHERVSRCQEWLAEASDPFDVDVARASLAEAVEKRNRCVRSWLLR